ncbi:type IV pilus biogenesis protein PilM [Peribacillus sp. NPDC097295]|uniref:type IV pilus biogenesis protein PilM n=1 Tax=Peribacillus sp. NPDC097295 TaxID=3364402 RepID=UPI003819968E
MAFSFFSGKNRIVNLIFKDYVIRYVELKQMDPPIVQAYGERYLPPGIIKEGKILDFETLQMIVGQCVEEWGLAKKQVRFLVPDPFVVIRKMMIPEEVKADEIEGYLYLELGTSIHLPFEDPIFDTVNLKENRESTEILLFAASEEQVSQYSDLLESTKLEPLAADISSLAIYRLWNLTRDLDSNEQLMLLELDVLSVTATIFVEDKPVFMRHILLPDEVSEWEVDHSSRNGLETLAYQGDRHAYFQTLEDTYVEIDRLLTFYKYNLNSGRDSVSTILVTGDHPYLEEICEKLSDHLDLPITILNESVEMVMDDAPLLRRYHSAVGLAIKGVQ